MKTFVLAVGLVLAASTLLAQEGAIGCDTPEVIEMELSENYQQYPVHVGTYGSRSIIVYMNEDTGRFTLIVEHSDSLACLAVAGETWETVNGN